MTKLLWMTIDRHPDSLKALIRGHLCDTGWEFFEVSYDSIDLLETVPLESIDAVLLAPARYFPIKYMDRLSSCKLMQFWSSGYDKFNTEDAHARGIATANNHGSNAISVAEHALLMMLSVSRRLPEMHDRVITGQWSGNDHGMSSRSLAGKTIGLIGLGKIGTLVAHRAEAFGMNIAFTDPAVDEPVGKNWRKLNYLDLLGEVDYLSFHVHLVAETRDLLNRDNMRLLKKRPFIINVSRAELINRDALIESLRSGRIRGVAMDAHYSEPTAEDDELLKIRGGVFSPHVAGSTADSYAETVRACIANIDAALTGTRVAGLID